MRLLNVAGYSLHMHLFSTHKNQFSSEILRIKINFTDDHLATKTVKFTSLKNLYVNHGMLCINYSSSLKDL